MVVFITLSDYTNEQNKLLNNDIPSRKQNRLVNYNTNIQTND